jgi:multidrug efflux pump subunit AcrB
MKRLTDFAISHKAVIFVLVVIATVLGLISYATLPREASPSITIPVVIVSTPYFGVAPSDIETLITQPIEKKLKEIADIEEIRSTSSEGFSSIVIEFDPDISIDDALQKVREKVDLAKPELPADAEDPILTEINLSRFPIMLVNIAGDIGLERLKKIAEDFEDRFEAIPGVLDVTIAGALEREVKINVAPERLEHYGIALRDVIDAIRDENINVPGGSVDVGTLSFLVRVPGEFDQVSRIKDLVVKTNEDKPIYIRDVADVVFGFKERTSLARQDGKEVVTLSVQKRAGENLIRISDQIKNVIAEMEPTLPPGTEITILADQSKDIRRMVNDLENNILSGLVLVMAVLLAFLGFRTSLFVAIAIPLSMLLSFIVIQALGLTLNMVVLFSLILALGMLVDNAIVIVENIYRHREEGFGPNIGARRGTHEVSAAITASTITTLCAFAPMLFWPGIVGEFMKYLPLTLIITLSMSLLVAIAINPVFCAAFLRSPKGNSKKKKKSHFLERILQRYEVLLRWALHKEAGVRRGVLRNWGGFIAFHSGLALLVIGGFLRMKGSNGFGGLLLGLGILMVVVPFLVHSIELVVSLVAGRWLRRNLVLTENRAKLMWGMMTVLVIIGITYQFVGKGVEFFPDTDPERLFIDVTAPTGTRLEETDRIVRQIEAVLPRDHPNIETYTVNVGVAGGDGSFADQGPSAGASNHARITVDFVDRKQRVESTSKTMRYLRTLLDRVAGATIEVVKPRRGPQSGPPIQIEIVGTNFSTLGELAQKVRYAIRDIPGLVDLKDNFDKGKPELRVYIDREKAAMLGLNTRKIASTVRTAIYGTEASKYRVDEDEYDITVRLKEASRKSIEALQRLVLYHEGKQIPLVSIAELEMSSGFSAIRRKDLKRVVTITANAEGRLANDVLRDVQARLANLSLPSGYMINYAGEKEEQAESQQFLTRAFVVALFLIFLVLVYEFNSVLMPFIILVTVPFSMIGVLIGLIVTRLPFGIIMTGIGVISLAGVVVNNAIVLLDYTKQLRERGLSKQDAIITAGKTRLRPVLLTAITTILGLIPLTIGVSFDFFSFELEIGSESSQWWGPMGVAVIFGLAISTFLTLVFVPSVYDVLDDLAIWLRNRFQFAETEPETDPTLEATEEEQVPA